MMSPRVEGVDLDAITGSERHSVLIVDDDPDNVNLLKKILRSAGFDVLSAPNGEEAIRKCGDRKPDLVLLDIMMPDMDGRVTFNYIRRISEDIPVIYISALDSRQGIVESLLDGADDYITKPFFGAEVVARVKTVLRRSGRPKDPQRYIFPNVGLIIDRLTKEVTLNDEVIQLTQKEFELLNLLAKNAPSVVNYPTLTRTIWDEESDDARKRAKYLVYLLRRKLQEIAPDKKLIVNVDRLGYKLVVG